eukprot:400447_1
MKKRKWKLKKNVKKNNSNTSTTISDELKYDDVAYENDANIKDTKQSNRYFTCLAPQYVECTSVNGEIYNRSIVLFDLIENKYQLVNKFGVELFEKRRDRSKITDETLWEPLYFPHLLRDICVATNKNELETILHKGNIEIEQLYDMILKSCQNNRELKLLWTVASIRVRKEYVVFKHWLIRYLNKDEQGKRLKANFGEHYHEEEYNEYICDAQTIEEGAKMILKNKCNNFLRYWEYGQNKIFSSSGFMEGIGNYLGGAMHCGASNHETVEMNATIASHCNSSECICRNMCKGVSDHLVDIGRGCIKSKETHNVKRRKYQDKSKAMIRMNKGKDNKFTTAFEMKASEVRAGLKLSKK